MKTLEICVFNMTNDKLAQAILEAFERGVKVRIITDDEKCEDKGSDVYRLWEAGIEVKTDSSHDHMHNKFAIIDNAIILTGSYNWTVSASNKNQENILILESKTIVNSYSNEFNKLWGQFKSISN
jgi:phosphatidylserine/phosphatidylglycerophosphate/cardiolipin synthase-like enzyme